MRSATALALILITAVLAGGCGGERARVAGDQEKTFDESSFALTFKYPAAFTLSDEVASSVEVGSGAKAKAKGLRLDEANGLVVQRYDLDTEVNGANLSTVKPQLDRLIASGTGRPASGRRVTFAELPGLEYEFDVRRPVGAHTRYIALFHGRTEYTVSCQHTRAKRAQVIAACERALDTLEVKR